MNRFINRYVLVYWPYYVAGLFALIVTNYLFTIIPLKIKEVIDLLVDEVAFIQIKRVLLDIIYLAIFLAITRGLSRLLIFFPGRFVEHDLRKNLFSHILNLSERFYRKETTGDLISRMINDIQSLRATASLCYLHIINTVMTYVFVIIQMVYIHPGLTVWIILPIPIAMGCVGFLVKYMYIYHLAQPRYVSFYSSLWLHFFCWSQKKY